ncbi:DUF3572 domain-containing protein [Tateyamaria omphalii]|uniref:DUF3572 domain-containing protein n=1 Tax=Tateyamaria omphalii TaxID=299262 RepID=UPI001C9986B5|nr:DUF3572 domain-containing protein [Tateyamaria omphalii]MBY5932031.1 DUF3572 domain-containing protein [Tateyamaria omphalii]
MSHSQESAEVVGLQAVAWMAGNEELLPVFLGATGASEADMRAGVGDPAFLGALLDFIMMDDAWVTAFCDAHTLPYDAPMRARMALPGGGDVHWT